MQPAEYQGGTASISNMGMFGITQFDAVINPPQGMIMAIGAGEKRPYVIDDSLQIATIMSATGSFDHRAIDGADGARLMQAFKRLVESPSDWSRREWRVGTVFVVNTGLCVAAASVAKGLLMPTWTKWGPSAIEDHRDFCSQFRCGGLRCLFALLHCIAAGARSVDRCPSPATAMPSAPILMAEFGFG